MLETHQDLQTFQLLADSSISKATDQLEQLAFSKSDIFNSTS